MKFLNKIEFLNIVTPTETPEAGSYFIYFKNDGKLYRKGPNGDESIISSSPSTKQNYNPGATNDLNEGYEVGDRWINIDNGSEYVAVAVDAGNAVWKNTTVGKAYELYQVTGPPTVNDDETQGYNVGDRWLDLSASTEYVATSVAAGAAVWTASTSDSTTVIEGDTIIEGDTVINSTMTFSGAIAFDNAISPPSLSNTDNNDYTPTGLETCNMMRLTSGGPNCRLTGIAAPNPAINQMIYIVNIDPTRSISIVNNSALSLAANRFIIKSDRTIQSNEGILIIYDKDSSRWRIVASDL